MFGKSYAQMMPNSSQNRPKILPKLSESRPKIVGNLSENCPKIVGTLSETRPKIVGILSENCPTTASRTTTRHRSRAHILTNNSEKKCFGSDLEP